MARGGINKALVQKARDTVRSRGEYPSIDALRIELGNTGSKTTIHRYMKELEEEEGSRLDDEALLSDTLKEMVARLASRLQEEARELVKKAEVTHETRAKEWQSLDATRQMALSAAEERVTALEAQLADTEQSRADLRERHQVLTLESGRQAQRISDQEALLAEKDRHLQSLEEKHRHARDSLEHYRQSVKEQRDQDQRRHEQQVQQLLAEERQLQQTLSIKNTDITQLNKDNARLLTELSETRKQLSAGETKRDQLEERIRKAEQQVAALSSQLETAKQSNSQQAVQLERWESRYNEVVHQKQQLEIEMAGLGTELDIKNRLMEKMESDIQAARASGKAKTEGGDSADNA